MFGSEVTSDVEFNTIDGFQGREVDILVLSTVRASESTNSSSIGFVADVRRMNVALTRARFSLWIVGNARTLQRNPHWAALIENAKERNLFVSISRPYDSIFENIMPSAVENPCSKSKLHADHNKKLAGKARHALGTDSAKEAPRGKSDLKNGKSHHHAKRFQNMSNDDNSSNETSPKHANARESTVRSSSLYKDEANTIQRNKSQSADADTSSLKNLKCSRWGSKIVQNVSLEADSSSTKELISKAKEAQKSSKDDLSSKLCQQSSSVASSAEDCNRVQSSADKVPIKKTKEARNSLAHIASSKLSGQSSTAASAAEGNHRVEDNALKRSKKEQRYIEHDTSSRRGHQNSLTAAASAEESHKSSENVMIKMAKEEQKSSECDTSTKLSQHCSAVPLASVEGSQRTREANDCQSFNLENSPGILNVKARRRFSEHKTSSRLSHSSTSSLASENETEKSDDKQNIREANDCQLPNLENTSGILKVKSRRRFSEHSTSSRLSQSSSTLPSASQNEMLTGRSDVKQNVRDAPKNLMETRKRQRDDIDALLSSALIPSKKSQNPSRPDSARRP